MTSTGPVPNFVPDIAILDIPFLFRDYAQARAVLDGPIGQDLLQKFDAKGIHALAWGENGFRNMTNSKHPVVVPEDLKGLKMRTMENPVHIQAYRAFGIIPTPMAFTEVFTALQQGTVDGQENPLSVITSAKLDQVQKYLTPGSCLFACVRSARRSGTSCRPRTSGDLQRGGEGRGEGEPRPHRRRREEGRRRPAHERHAGRRERRQGEVPVALAPTFAEFGKKFGQDNIDRIRNYK